LSLADVIFTIGRLSFDWRDFVFPRFVSPPQFAFLGTITSFSTVSKFDLISFSDVFSVEESIFVVKSLDFDLRDFDFPRFVLFVVFDAISSSSPFDQSM
jgi:hypothetical protein